MKEEDKKQLKKYVLIRDKYISKKLLITVFLLVLLFPPFFDFVLMPLYERFFADHTLYLDSPALAAFSGRGKVYDKEKRLVYVGDIAEGVFQGKGRLYDEAANLIYSGDFEASAFQGSGRAYRTDGVLLYDGGFESGRFQGEGKLYENDGQLLYEGGFESGIYSGQGTLYTSSGRLLYEGAFTAGQKNGFGNLYADNGRLLYDGLFREDRIDYASWVGVAYEEMKQGFHTRIYLNGADKTGEEKSAKEASEQEEDKILQVDGKSAQKNEVQNPIAFIAAFEHLNMAAALSKNDEGNPDFVEFLCLWGEEADSLLFPDDPVMSWTVYDSGKDHDGKKQPEWMEMLRKNRLFPKEKEVSVLTVGYKGGENK